MQILIEAPGKAPFWLTRLGGAPHGQPALALRQVQVTCAALTSRVHDSTAVISPQCGVEIMFNGRCNDHQLIYCVRRLRPERLLRSASACMLSGWR